MPSSRGLSDPDGLPGRRTVREQGWWAEGRGRGHSFNRAHCHRACEETVGGARRAAYGCGGGRAAARVRGLVIQL